VRSGRGRLDARLDSRGAAVDAGEVDRRPGTSVEASLGMRRVSRSILFVSVLSSCTAGPPDSLDGFGEVGEADDDGTTAATSSGGAPVGSDDDDDGSSTGAEDPAGEGRFDLAAPDVGPESDPCGLVDLLFVIDNSGSMGDEQQNLVASFPGFITGIESILPSSEYHVGVITTDANEFNGNDCRRIGALTVQTGGDLSSDAQCGPFADGHHFMTAADDLDTCFSCAAQVGIDGSGIERPLDAIAAALDPVQADLDECNAEFLRDEALLVLVLITDEEDDGDSLGDPADWHDMVVAAKGGDAERVVVLSLVGHDKPNECIAAQWTGMAGAEISPRLIEFTESFPFGRVGDVCAASYEQFFTDGIVGIADACHVVVPVG